MNILEFLKNGSGIHIKKKNRGKFTLYCGGKVTSACIQRGKNSSNPAIRKRATFAANARKWKHQEGGTIINQSPIVAQRMMWLLQLPDILLNNEELKQQKINLEIQKILQQQNLFNTILGTAKDIGLNLLSKKYGNTQQSNSN